MLAQSSRVLVAIAIAVSIGYLALTASSNAQQSTVFDVIIPATVLSLPSPDGTLRQSYREISVYSNGQFCTTANLASSSGDVVLHVGLPGQPPACSIPGATLSFLNGQYVQLYQTLTIGGRNILDNMAPVPPGGGAMMIVVSRDSLATETANGRLGTFLGQLTAKVSDTGCTTADVSQASRDVVLPVGLPGQPAACTTVGSRVSIVDSKGFELAQSFVLGSGGRARLTNLALLSQGQQSSEGQTAMPPAASEPPPVGACLADCGLRQSLVKPPGTGDGGLR
jgi:hypothetical protein